MTERKSNYAEFWPYYLQEHGKSNTRFLHFVGTEWQWGSGLHNLRLKAI